MIFRPQAKDSGGCKREVEEGEGCGKDEVVALKDRHRHRSKKDDQRAAHVNQRIGRDKKPVNNTLIIQLLWDYLDRQKLKLHPMRL